MATSAPLRRLRGMKSFHPPIFTGLILLSIAGCNKQDPVDSNANAIAPVPANPASTDAVSGGPPPVSNNAEPGSGIPVAIQGRWGLTPADCIANRSDTKGLLEITADSLKFYESRAIPGTSIERDDTGISGNFNFTGEGQNWSKYVSLKLQGDGLVRTERSPMASYTYAKCD